MTAAQGVQLILDDLGPQRREDDFLVALRMRIVSRQRVPASVAIAGLDRDPFVHLLDRYPRAAVSFVPGLSARRAPRGSASGGVGARRGGSARLRRGGPGTAAGPPLAAGQFPLQLGDPRRLLFHDPLELDNALAQVAFGNRTLRGSLHGVAVSGESATHNRFPKIPTNPKTRVGISLYAQTTTAGD